MLIKDGQEEQEMLLVGFCSPRLLMELSDQNLEVFVDLGLLEGGLESYHSDDSCWWWGIDGQITIPTFLIVFMIKIPLVIVTLSFEM